MNINITHFTKITALLAGLIACMPLSAHAAGDGFGYLDLAQTHVQAQGTGTSTSGITAEAAMQIGQSGFVFLAYDSEGPGLTGFRVGFGSFAPWVEEGQRLYLRLDHRSGIGLAGTYTGYSATIGMREPMGRNAEIDGSYGQAIYQRGGTQHTGGFYTFSLIYHFDDNMGLLLRYSDESITLGYRSYAAGLRFLF